MRFVSEYVHCYYLHGWEKKTKQTNPRTKPVASSRKKKTKQTKCISCEFFYFTDQDYLQMRKFV